MRTHPVCIGRASAPIKGTNFTHFSLSSLISSLISSQPSPNLSDLEQVPENVPGKGGEIEEEEVPEEGAIIEVLQPLAQEEPEDIP
ncbi:hypothetical protein PIB30_032582 [Stylosanthes scabra]|uniref:Uncharacterized protein n=1 Tax=Stylosanthes scabra TaxID=79078 RepID=A0ABU6SCF1_9FABA|nr:hypothetical protein [Stylosanthes scabra]